MDRYFQSLQEVWRGESEALGRAMPQEKLSALQFFGGIHPVQLDGCVQVLAAALAGREEEPERLYLPLNLERYQVYNRFKSHSQPLLAHAHLRPRDGIDAATVTGDIRI